MQIASSKQQKSGRMTNYMEELADDILGDLLDKEKSARFTPNAIQDIKALALNRLWPMYITTNSGKDFIRKIVIEDKIEKDVIRELRAAMDIVRSHPRV
jgi:hypothetical protein